MRPILPGRNGFSHPLRRRLACEGSYPSSRSNWYGARLAKHCFSGTAARQQVGGVPILARRVEQGLAGRPNAAMSPSFMIWIVQNWQKLTECEWAGGGFTNERDGGGGGGRGEGEGGKGYRQLVRTNPTSATTGDITPPVATLFGASQKLGSDLSRQDRLRPMRYIPQPRPTQPTAPRLRSGSGGLFPIPTSPAHTGCRTNYQARFIRALQIFSAWAG